MDLVFLLILTVLSIGQSYGRPVAQNTSSCYAQCLPGYRKMGGCDDPIKRHRCEPCTGKSYTDILNLSNTCMKCTECGYKEVEVQPCVYNSNTKCDCPEGQYYLGHRDHGDCQPCSKTLCQESSDKHDCKRKCQSNITTSTSTIPPTTSSSTFTTTVTITKVTTNSDKIPWNNLTWLMGLLFLSFLVLLWLLLVFWCCLKTAVDCPCWSVNKDLQLPEEDPKVKESHNIQGRGLNTLTLNRNPPEEPANMTFSQSSSTQKPSTPAITIPLLADSEHRADRQVVQSEQWPAKVLYLVIEQVPPRRWKEFLRILSMADQQMERVELEAGLCRNIMEMQYQMLRLWSQRSSSSINQIFSALHDMNLSGRALHLQEDLVKLTSRSELKQSVTASWTYTENGLNVVTQET